jgi:hypothetical protein
MYNYTYPDLLTLTDDIPVCGGKPPPPSNISSSVLKIHLKPNFRFALLNTN